MAKSIDEKAEAYLTLSTTEIVGLRVLNGITAIPIRSLQNSLAARVGVLGAIMFGICAFIDFILGWPKSFALISAGFTAVALIVILTLKYIQPLAFPLFVHLVKSEMDTPDGKNNLFMWLPTYIRFSKQFFWSVLGGGLTTISFFVADQQSPSLIISPGVYFSIFIMFFFGTSFPYLAIAFIDAFRILSNYPTKIHPFQAAGAEVIERLKELVISTLLSGSITIAAFFGVTLVSYGSYLSEILIRAAILFWYFLALVLLLAIFLLCNLYISKIIHNAKLRVLENLQVRIENTYLNMDGIDPVIIEKIMRALELYKLINNTPSNALFSWQTIQSLGLAVLPQLPIINNLFDWKKVIASILGF